MTVCRITNDGICIDDSVDTSKLYKREEVTIKTFVVTLFSKDAPRERVYQSSILEYPLPRPFDNYLYNSPVYMRFTGGTIDSDEHAERLLTLLGNIFVHTDDSLEETPSIIYEKIENDESTDYDNQEDDPVDYYNPELSDDENENDEDVEYSEDEDDDDSKLEGDSQMGDDTSLK